MPPLVALMKWEVIIFLGAMAGIVAVQLLTGQINTSGLFRAKAAGPRGKSEQISPARVQLLVSTLGAASYYLSQVLANKSPGTFPPIPETWPAILGGSNLLYLGGKAYGKWFGQRNTK
jgi:hypothetical protein